VLAECMERSAKPRSPAGHDERPIPPRDRLRVGEDLSAAHDGLDVPDGYHRGPLDRLPRYLVDDSCVDGLRVVVQRAFRDVAGSGEDHRNDCQDDSHNLRWS
jgi:hypothetical protein